MVFFAFTIWTTVLVLCIFFYKPESIPYLVGLLHEALKTPERRSNGLEARELCKGLSKLAVADNNKYKVEKDRLQKNRDIN